MEKPFPYNNLFVPHSIKASGHLRTDGGNSTLTLLSPAELKSTDEEFTDIHGTLKNGSKASLLECIWKGHTRHRFDENSTTISEFFPHIVVVGNQYVNSSNKCVKAIQYHFENVECLIHNMGTFDELLAERDDLLKLLETDHKRREKIAERQGWETRDFDPKLGEHPVVLYFNGIFEIIKCECDLGTVRLTNRPTIGSGSAAGVAIGNEVTARLEFNEPQKVEAATNHLFRLHKLFELCLGRPQRYLNIEIVHKDEKERDEPFKVYWSGCNEHISGKTKATHIADILLNAVRRPEEFSKVVAGWLNSDTSMGNARRRFSSTFGQNSYGIDRIVGAANMFDLLPDDRVPKQIKPDDETMAAVGECRKTFKALPRSFARESVLNALGRVGKASLSDKIIHRADILKAVSAEKFTEIEIPCREAVLCRNHYVHGSDASFDYRENFSEFAFLTDTLEFVFAASDLIELGWSFEAWREHAYMSHGFGSYAINYAENLKRLKTILFESELRKLIERERTRFGSLPDLSRRILALARKLGRVTTSGLVAQTDASPATVRRHVSSLVKAGHLTQNGKGRGIWYART